MSSRALLPRAKPTFGARPKPTVPKTDRGQSKTASSDSLPDDSKKGSVLSSESVCEDQPGTNASNVVVPSTPEKPDDLSATSVQQSSSDDLPSSVVKCQQVSVPTPNPEASLLKPNEEKVVPKDVFVKPKRPPSLPILRAPKRPSLAALSRKKPSPNVVPSQKTNVDSTPLSTTKSHTLSTPDSPTKTDLSPSLENESQTPSNITQENVGQAESQVTKLTSDPLEVGAGSQTTSESSQSSSSSEFLEAVSNLIAEQPRLAIGQLTEDKKLQPKKKIFPKPIPKVVEETDKNAAENSRRVIQIKRPKFVASTYGKMHKEVLTKLKEKFISAPFPDTESMTMKDFIFYNPKNRPGYVHQKVVTTNTLVRPKNESNANLNESSTMDPTPKIKINVDGGITIDTSSMIVPNDRGNEVVDDSSSVASMDTNGAMKKERHHWSKEDTLNFYKALLGFGTDFTSMCTVFKDRSRKNLKLKFKREERYNSKLVERTLFHHRNTDNAAFVQELEAMFLRKAEERIAEQEDKPPEPKKQKKYPKKQVTKELAESILKKSNTTIFNKGREQEDALSLIDDINKVAKGTTSPNMVFKTRSGRRIKPKILPDDDIGMAVVQARPKRVPTIPPKQYFLPGLKDPPPEPDEDDSCSTMSESVDEATIEEVICISADIHSNNINIQSSVTYKKIPLPEVNVTIQH